MRFAVFNPDAERREGLKALLRQIDRRARFNDAPDWRSAERAMQRFSPNLLVIDWHEGILPGELRHFANRHKTLPIAVLVDRNEPPHRVRAILDEGARGIIRRTTDSILIVKLLELIMLGGDHLPADIFAPSSCPPGPRPVPPRRNSRATAVRRKGTRKIELSPRQEQILRCVHMGSTNKMIARALGISEGTVKVHLASIFQQLGAPNRAAAVAIYNGLLSSQLQVLRARRESAPKPAYGEHGQVPLRKRSKTAFLYPLQTDDTLEALPLAAEPATSYSTASPDALAPPAPLAASQPETSEEQEAPPGCAHLLPSNE
ncbi:response regulator transcription factor [Burkholderia sp. Ax-1719]|uniref:response regulator transcription factor n=1 Tax=Burkholderia sp. Ax-1719 TaxID=2608334 RepID=UPI0014221575|nr:response regulator transcription factor [Burkholderia sp. Ax-1719]NIE68916.1 response regulator transcription factor [Burkholderia sp. Ax-1719]